MHGGTKRGTVASRAPGRAGGRSSPAAVEPVVNEFTIGGIATEWSTGSSMTGRITRCGKSKIMMGGWRRGSFRTLMPEDRFQECIS